MNKYGVIKRSPDEPNLLIKIKNIIRKQSAVNSNYTPLSLCEIEKVFIDNSPSKCTNSGKFVIYDKFIYEFEDDEAAKLYYELKDYD